MDGLPAPLPPGYELVGRLGAGAFGEVVLARHVRLGRLVAIKRILTHALADPENVQRFRREAQILARQDSPTVVGVFDLTTVDGTLHLVMEHVPGRTLAQALEHGPLPAPAALQVLRDVATALRTMAAQGIVHRDVKPGNVFVLPDGHAKLGDFGLARALADASAFRTAGGSPAGTPAYFPPEVSLGRSEPDERSDAYSFAVMAFESLTGQRPFSAPDALAMITAHWEQPPLDPRQALPGIPEPAATTLLAGLAKDPADRPLPFELVDRLATIPASDWPHPAPRASATADSGGEQDTLFRPGPPRRLESPTPPGVLPGRRRRRLVPWLVAAAVVLAGGAAVTVLAFRGPGELRVELVTVDVRPDDTGTCPRASFQFDATIATNGAPGVVSFVWTRPDGVRLEPREVRVQDGQRAVPARLEFSVDGGAELEGEAVLDVLAPGRQSASRTVTYSCDRS